MIRDLCEICNQPEKGGYLPGKQRAMPSRAGSKTKHQVDSFTCSACVQRLLHKTDKKGLNPAQVKR